MNKDIDLLYSKLFENIELGVVYQNKEGRIIDVNPAAENILGFSKDEMNAMTSDSNEWDPITANYTPFAGKDHPTMVSLATGKTITNVVMGIMHPKLKERRWIKVSSYPDFNDIDTLAYRVMATFSDVTHEFELESDLHETEIKFTDLFQNAPIGIAYYKLVYGKNSKEDDFVFLDVNKNIIDMIGMNPIGKMATEFFPGIMKDSDVWIEKLCNCAKYGQTISFEQYFTSIEKSFRVDVYQSSPDHFVTTFFDMTTEYLLKKEVTEKAFLVDSSLNKISMASLDRKITYANKSFLKSWGYSHMSEVVGRDILDFWKIEDRIDNIIKAIFEKGQTQEDAVAVRADGSEFDVRTLASAVFDDKGEPIALMSSSEDITELKRTEKSLVQSNERFKQLVERSSDAVFLVDLDTGKYMNANAAAAELTGYSIEELKELTVNDITIESGNIGLEDLVGLRDSKNYGEIKYIKPNGEVKYALLTVVPVSNNRMFGIAHDITERKIAESEVINYNNKLEENTKALKRTNDELNIAIDKVETSRARVTSIIENTTDSIWAINRNYEIIYINNVFRTEFEQSFGINLKAGMSLLNSLPDIIKPLWKDRYDKALGGERFVFEDKVEIGTGVFLYIQVGMNPIKVDGKIIGASFFGSNITERKQIEADIIAANENLTKTTLALKKSNKELEQALVEARKSKELTIANRKLSEQKNEIAKTLDELKDTQSQLIQAEKMASMGILTAGVAHELNNPLNYIQGSTLAIENFIDDELPDKKELINDFISNIYLGVKRASNIIKSLNHFSRRSEDVTENCDIHTIVDNCLVMLHNEIKYKAVVNKHFTDGSVIVVGNEGKLHQLFVNIVSNATDAISQNGVIEVRTTINDSWLEVDIADDGEGISKKDLDKVMDPFYTTKPPGKGTGLGLSIVYRIIEEHKGKIKFTSELGKGTQVKISLLLKKD